MKIFSLALALTLAAGTALAQQDDTAQQDERASKPIRLSIGAPEAGDTLGCHLPLSASLSEGVDLETLSLLGEVYEGERKLHSTGVKLGDSTVVRETSEGAEEATTYESVPAQLPLGQESCEGVTSVVITMARCTPPEGETVDCLQWLELEESEAGQVAVSVGVPVE